MRVACIWFQKDVQIDEVAQFCWNLTSQVSVRKSRAVFVEVGSQADLASELEFIKNTSHHLKGLNLKASITLGDTIFSALLKARFDNPDIDSIPLGGLMDVADPFEHDMILRKYTERMILTLQDLGVLTLGQFKKIPRSELSSRFGSLGMLCRQRLQNDSQIAWHHWSPPVSSSEQKLETKESHGRENSLYPPSQSYTVSPTQNTDGTLPADPSAAREPVRPLYLLKPVPIEVNVDSVQFDGKSYKISKWNEYDERISNGNSDKTMSDQQCSDDCDYYQLEVEDGKQFTIFETSERQFYLHGYSG